MNEILMNLLAVVLLLAGFVALIRFARGDAFGGPGVGHRDTDELRRTPSVPAA